MPISFTLPVSKKSQSQEIAELPAFAPAPPYAAAPAVAPPAEPPIFEAFPALPAAPPADAAPSLDEPAPAPVASFATPARAVSTTHAHATNIDERSIDSTLHQPSKDVAL
jgi:hypothetical protein